MGLLNERIQPLGYENSALANYQPSQSQPSNIGFLEALGQAFVPETMARLSGIKAQREAPSNASYAQLAEYWAQRGDPEKAQQYAELAGLGQPKAREVFSRTEGVVNDQGETGVLLTYRNGEQEFKPVKYSPDSVKPGRAPAAPRVPVGMMWDPNKEMAVQIPGVPVKAAPAARGGPASGSANKGKGLSATEFKELTETEDVLSASRAAARTIDEALKINPDAYSGLTAKPRAIIESQVGGNKRADATIKLDNLIQNQALSSMKAIFGGNPTEGERKILLDLQASADKTPEQRAEILGRAKQAALARVESNARKATGIRSGSYGRPEYEQQTPKPKVRRYNPATGRIE